MLCADTPPFLLGAPVTVDQDEIGENFQGSRITDKLTLSRCQGEALSLMSASEITVYDLGESTSVPEKGTNRLLTFLF